MKKIKHPSGIEIFGTFIFLLLLWKGASVLIGLPILPPPEIVIPKMIQIFPDDLKIHLGYSCGRVLLGMGIAALVGAVMGYLMGMFPKFNWILSPLLYFTYPIPKVALLPAVMLLCGLGLLSKTLMIVLIVIFQIILTVRDAVQSLPTENFYLLRALGANPWQIFREIVFPASLPSLLTAIRLGLGTAISILFFTETYGTSYGIGYFIMDAWMRMNYPEMYAGIFLLSLCGFFFFFMVDQLEKITCRWQQSPR